MAASEWSRARHAARSWHGQLINNSAAESLPDPLGGDRGAFVDALLAVAVSAEGLRVRPLRSDDPLLFGALAVLDVEAETIWIRKSVSPAERRLILAHELGHRRLHHAPEDCRCDDGDLDELPELAVGYGPRQRRETEANAYAREFLLPADLARSLFFERGCDARTIASRLGLPPAVVFDQLALQDSAPADNTFLSDITADPGLLEAAQSLLEALDPSQAEAARAVQGPLLVGAGPGTGKTRTLTARILHLIRDRHVPAERVLALTFSRKAADEMRERLAAQDTQLAARVSISTFHAYGLDLLRRQWKAAKLPPRPVLLAEAEAYALLERRMAQVELGPLRYLHDPAFPLPDILRAISQAKEALVDPPTLKARAEAAGDARWQDVAIVYALYEDLLRERGAIDFPDLIARALRLLENNEAVRDAERARWLHVLVDEYQDVNRAGARLVRSLTGAGSGLWAVGDLRQAIYAFRGASPANITQFSEDFPSGRRSELAVNYRSRPDLVALFGVAAGESAEAWQPYRDGAASVALAVAEDDVAQADGIAGAMFSFHRDGYSWRDQVALCRTRNQAKALRRALDARNVPVASGDSGGLLTRPDVRRLVTLISRVADPNGPAQTALVNLPAGLDTNPECDALELMQNALWGQPAWARDVVDAPAVAQLLGLARTFRERAPIILEEGDDPRRGFLEHLRRLSRLGALRVVEDADENRDAVRVLTIHASKGLEFPIVFVPNLSAGKFPSRPAPSLLPAFALDDEAPGDEEARLFFVAVTRARDHLVLSRAERYGKIGAAPSPLLAALADHESIEARVWWRDDDSDARDLSDDSADESPLDERPTVSAGDAELYLRCPRRYSFERIDQLPAGAPSAYEAFKRALMAASDAAEDDAESALEVAWAERGPDDSHPYAAFYRDEARRIIARGGAPRRGQDPGERPDLLTVTLPNGDITVRPDAVSSDGALERHTLRKPPAIGEERVAAEPRLSLLQAAGEGAPVRVRYLQNGESYEVADRARTRQKHLETYDRAIRGIRLRLFPAAPADNTDCPACPFFFVCDRGDTG